MNPNPPKEDDPKSEEQIDYLADLHPTLRRLAVERGNTTPVPWEEMLGPGWPEDESKVDFDAWLRQNREGHVANPRAPNK